VLDARRILITGLSSSWGGQLAQELERDPQVEAVVGVDLQEPRHRLQRTEFVRTAIESEPLARILSAAAIDTVIDTRLTPDPPLGGLGAAREVNVAGTRRLLDACAQAATLRKLVFRSSDRRYGSGPGQPAFLVEEPPPWGDGRGSEAGAEPGEPAAGTAAQADVLAAERALAQLARARPQLTVTVLRFATVIGGEQRGGLVSLLELPVVPGIVGFDPRWALVHERDAIAALAHCVRRRLPGIYNVAGDGVLVLSEIASLLGKPLVPLLPAWGAIATARLLRALSVPVALELLVELRHGRGLDNRRLKATGFQYRYTGREAVLALGAQRRARRLLGATPDDYRYRPEVEEFLRRSPSVSRLPGRAEEREAGAGAPSDALGEGAETPYDTLSENELLGLIPSLDAQALALLHAHEATHRRRERLLWLLEHQLRLRGRSAAAPPG